MTRETYNNHDAKNKSFSRLSDVFAVSDKCWVPEGENRLHLTDVPIPTKVLPIDHGFFPQKRLHTFFSSKWNSERRVSYAPNWFFRSNQSCIMESNIISDAKV